MHKLEDWLEHIESASCTHQRWHRIEAAFAEYGFNRIIFLQLNSKKRMDVASSFGASWHNYYLEREFEKNDPFLRYCASTYQPVRTGIAHLKEHHYLTQAECQVIQEAADAGFNSGFSCTIERFNGTRATAWNIGSSLPRQEVDKILVTNQQKLQLLCHHAQRFLHPHQSTPLTEREKEVLHLLAQGLRYKKIAAELAISVATVEFHMGNARKKLTAKTPEHAIALAVAQQVIQL